MQIASYTVTIPAGSFHQLWNSPQAPYTYAGTINGTNLVVGLVSLGKNNYQFGAARLASSFRQHYESITVSFIIGNDAGSALVNALISMH